MGLALIVGARPNFMKIAPLVNELEKYGIIYHLIHTGQHYDFNMSEIFFTNLGLQGPHYYLGVGSGTNNYQTAKAMLKLEGVFSELRPELVIVVGDVNSTLAGSLAAVKLGFKVAHVEAGLRSFDRSMPEEINRVLTDAISDQLFTSCVDANANLIREGISKEKIYFVGNIMIDTLKSLMPEIVKSPILHQLDLENKAYMYITLHRPSNVDIKEQLVGIAGALNEVASIGLKMVFAMHPRTKQCIMSCQLLNEFKVIKGLMLLDPLGYIESMAITRGAQIVLTDSGGLQEETTYLGVPCLTLRPNTERPITINEGTNTLLDKGPSMIPPAVSAILGGNRKSWRIPELWDGNTAQRIVRVIKNLVEAT